MPFAAESRGSFAHGVTPKLRGAKRQHDIPVLALVEAVLAETSARLNFFRLWASDSAVVPLVLFYIGRR